MLQRVDFIPTTPPTTLPKVNSIEEGKQNGFKAALYEMTQKERREANDALFQRAKENLMAAGWEENQFAILTPIIELGPQAMLDNFMSQMGPITVTYADHPLLAPHLRGRTVTLHTNLAMEVKLGLMHKSKYFDFLDTDEKLRKLLEATSTANHKGMSNAAKALAIYTRWDEAFGDFRKAAAIQYTGSMSSDLRTDQKIINQFNNELISVFGSVKNAEAAYRTAIYGNMSNAEVREAIAAKYPPMDKITLREFHEMVWEMQVAGADEGLSNVLFRAATDGVGVLAREELLDYPLDVSWFVSTYNTMRNAAAKTSYNDVGNSAVVLNELFGVYKESGGNLATNRRSSVNYQTLIPQLQQKYANWTENDYMQWLYSQFEKEHEQWMKENR